jgi:hypothetical protein
VISIHDS